MVRLRRDLSARSVTLWEYFRERTQAQVDELQARIEKARPGSDSEVAYPVARFCDRARQRLADMDAGRPITVGAWELPRGTEVPARSWSYVLCPDGGISMNVTQGVDDG